MRSLLVLILALASCAAPLKDVRKVDDRAKTIAHELETTMDLIQPRVAQASDMYRMVCVGSPDPRCASAGEALDRYALVTQVARDSIHAYRDGSADLWKASNDMHKALDAANDFLDSVQKLP